MTLRLLLIIGIGGFLVYAIASVALGILATIFGIWITKPWLA